MEDLQSSPQHCYTVVFEGPTPERNPALIWHISVDLCYCRDEELEQVIVLNIAGPINGLGSSRILEVLELTYSFAHSEAV